MILPQRKAALMEILPCFLVPIGSGENQGGKGDRSRMGSVSTHCSLHQGIHCPDVAILIL